MLLATNRGAGMNLGFPDVCLTPAGPVPAPVPYPNIALHAMTLGFSPNVLLTGMNALNLLSIIPITLGHQPGVAHPLYMQQGRFLMGSPVVFVNQLPGIHQCAPAIGNMGNAAMCVELVPSVTNVFYTLRTEGDPEAAADVSVARRVADELASDGGDRAPVVAAALGEAGVAHVRIERFSLDVPARVASAVRVLERGGMRAMRIDLRGNPGGELASFLELAGDFLPEGAVIATTSDEDGDEVEHVASQPRPYRFPVDVLVDRDTASAAELFALCLEAHGRAAIHGGPTHGKHVATRLGRTPDGEPTLASTLVVRPGPTAT